MVHLGMSIPFSTQQLDVTTIPFRRTKLTTEPDDALVSKIVDCTQMRNYAR